MLGWNFYGQYLRRHRGKLAFICTVLATSQLLSGCGLLPEKEEPKIAPVLHTYEQETYNLVYVNRGDIVARQTIFCNYTQLNDETLSFPVTGVKVETVYVKPGDYVKKGDLLAQLELGNIDEQIEDLENTIKKTELQKKQSIALMEADITKQHIISKETFLSSKESEQAIRTIRDRYNNTIRSYDDSLYINKKKLDNLKEKRETHRLYAGMDGSISFIKKNLEDSTSKKDEPVITIIDSTATAFRAESPYASLINEDDKLIIKVRDKSYPTIAKPSKEEENVIYFYLIDPDLSLKIGDNGTTEIILGEKDNVLYLPRSAVRKMEDSYFVYYIDETGVQNLKKIEIGLEGDNKSEIISGLEYGDPVVNNK